jgi:hypothetical protein
MKKSVFSIIASLLFATGVLQAQDISGTWQGTLQADRELRIVVKLSKADTSGLKAILYSIDQGGEALPADTVMFQNPNVTISIPAVGGTFVGKLNAEGNSITGMWSQGPQPLPLVLVRTAPEVAWEIPGPTPLKPMAADANPVFEVATIKLSRPEEWGKGFRVQGRRFSTFHTSLADLITFAYGLHDRQITNAPEWLDSEKYDYCLLRSLWRRA